jgi:hypothetical protein
MGHGRHEIWGHKKQGKMLRLQFISLRGTVLGAASRSLSTSSTQRPFRILGFQQIAIGSEDKGKLNFLFQVLCSGSGKHALPRFEFESEQELLGLKKIGSFRSEKENVDEDILTVAYYPRVIEFGTNPFRVDHFISINGDPVSPALLFYYRIYSMYFDDRISFMPFNGPFLSLIFVFLDHEGWERSAGNC